MARKEIKERNKKATKKQKQKKCQFLGLHSGAVETFVPLDSCERQVGSSLPTFRDICLIAEVQEPKWGGGKCCPEISVTHYQPPPRNVASSKTWFQTKGDSFFIPKFEM
jgi:hypothetical protein